MAFKIRFLLTSRCTATCAYCHNEGQVKSGPALLSLDVIDAILGTLQANQCMPDEIILSGGEPTLHKKVGDIARRCKATGAYVSMDTHGGHPDLLRSALAYLDELKVHIDSFEADQQYASMGIDIGKVLTSLRIAQQFPLALRANHPLKCAVTTAAFVSRARTLSVDCKIIELFGMDSPAAAPPSVDWRQYGYSGDVHGQWLHANGTHRLFTKNCGAEHNLRDDSLFIGADGIRRAVDGVIIGQPENFSMRMVKRAAGAGSPELLSRRFAQKFSNMPVPVHQAGGKVATA